MLSGRPLPRVTPMSTGIYRLTVSSEVRFSDGDPVVLAPGTLCPFNSQNTIFSQRVFPLLYLPATVTFRSTDIVRAYVAQPILWASGLRLGFTGPNVTQDRNEHDFLRDFESELPLYLRTEEIVEAVRESVEPERSIEDNLRSAYSALVSRDLVGAEELTLLEAWLEDLATTEAPG